MYLNFTLVSNETEGTFCTAEPLKYILLIIFRITSFNVVRTSYDLTKLDHIATSMIKLQEVSFLSIEVKGNLEESKKID